VQPGAQLHQLALAQGLQEAREKSLQGLAQVKCGWLYSAMSSRALPSGSVNTARYSPALSPK
jgi:hypothetical protein